MSISSFVSNILAAPMRSRKLASPEEKKKGTRWQRFLEWARHWPERYHWRRYILGGAVSVMGILAMAAAYMVLTPPSYTSKWTLILPGSGAGVSVSLDTIGSASSLAASPFSSSTLSPKVIYKEIATSEQVVAAAAKSMDMPIGKFGAPRIKLIDETALMLFEISGRTAQEAQDKAEAIIGAFDRQLDLLRHDEIDRRASGVRDTLRGYQSTLHTARERILDMQETSGLISVEQFSEVATGLEQTKRKLAEAKVQKSQLEAEQALLIERLGVTPQQASMALVLAADPLFIKTLSEYAEATASISGQAQWLGPKNPSILKDVSRRDNANVVLAHIARRAGIDPGSDLPRLVLVLNSKSREELLKALVVGESQLKGKQREMEALEADIEEQTIVVRDMTTNAARLEDLKKDHLVAEAVFSSALARLDTNKADLYASYPIVQVLAKPDLPSSKAAPKTIFAIAGGLGGSLLAMAAWVLAWLRQLFVLKRRKSA